MKNPAASWVQKKVAALDPLVAAMQFFQLLRQGSAILTSIFLAKSALTVAEIGLWEQLLFVGSTASFFWANGLLQGLLPLWPKCSDDERKSLIFNALCTFAAFAAGLFFVFFFGKKWLLTGLVGRSDLPHFELFVGWLALNLVSLPLEHFYLLQKRPRAVAAWGAASFLGQIAATVGPLFLGFSLRESLVALLVLAAAKTVWAIGFGLKFGKIGLDKSLTINYLRLAWPLAVGQILGQAVVLFDFWILAKWAFSDADFALFRYGARELPLALALTAGLSTALIPRIAADQKAGLEELRKKSKRLGNWIFPISIALALAAAPLFEQIFRAEFRAAAPIFCLFLLQTAPRMVLGATVLNALGESRPLLFFTGFELILKILIGSAGLYFFGILGLAASGAVVFLAEKGAMLWFLSRKHGIRPSQIVDLAWLAAWSAGLFAAVIFSIF